MRASNSVKLDLELLINRHIITKPLYENIVYADVELSEDIFWSFLFFSGYLTFSNMRLINKKNYVDFSIPNDEVVDFFETTISSWFK